MDTTKPPRMTIALDADVLAFARKVALQQSKPGAIKATANVLRDLMREGKEARERKQGSKQ